jgi:hypothetical protein
MNYTSKERLLMCIDIVKKLQNYEGKNGHIINLYNEEYQFIKDLKEIHNKYIKQPDDNVKEYRGSLFFEEIGKRVDYIYPATKNNKQLFVIRHRNA